MKCCVFMVWKKVRLGKRVGKNGCLCLGMRPEGLTCLGDDRRVMLKKPRSDINGEGESEVTETSTQQANKNRNRGLNPKGGRNRGRVRLNHHEAKRKI